MDNEFFTVVGFGIVVPVDLFLDQVSDDAETLDELAEGFDENFGVSVYYSIGPIGPKDVFVTTKDAVRVGGIMGEYSGHAVVPVSLKMNQDLESLYGFVKEHFSEFTIQLIAYSYEIL